MDDTNNYSILCVVGNTNIALKYVQDIDKTIETVSSLYFIPTVFNSIQTKTERPDSWCRNGNLILKILPKVINIQNL